MCVRGCVCEEGGWCVKGRDGGCEGGERWV